MEYNLKHQLGFFLSVTGFAIIDSYDRLTKSAVANHLRNPDFLSQNLNDFSIPYFMTVGVLSYVGKVKDNYYKIGSVILPAVFTLNEFYPVIPASGGRTANTFDPLDIAMYWSAGLLAYLTVRTLNSNSFDNLCRKLNPFKKKEASLVDRVENP